MKIESVSLVNSKSTPDPILSLVREEPDKGAHENEKNLS